VASGGVSGGLGDGGDGVQVGAMCNDACRERRLSGFFDREVSIDILNDQGHLPTEELSVNRLGGDALPTACDQTEVTISLLLHDLIALRNGEQSMASGPVWRAAVSREALAVASLEPKWGLCAMTHACNVGSLASSTAR
jgi:hypothetical protein